MATVGVKGLNKKPSNNKAQIDSAQLHAKDSIADSTLINMLVTRGSMYQ